MLYLLRLLVLIRQCGVCFEARNMERNGTEIERNRMDWNGLGAHELPVQDLVICECVVTLQSYSSWFGRSESVGMHCTP